MLLPKEDPSDEERTFTEPYLSFYCIPDTVLETQSVGFTDTLQIPSDPD